MRQRIPNNLRRVRESLNRTQIDIAAENNIFFQAYQRYENGTVQPTVRNAIRIARSLGTTVENLWPLSPKDTSHTE